METYGLMSWTWEAAVNKWASVIRKGIIREDFVRADFWEGFSLWLDGAGVRAPDSIRGSVFRDYRDFSNVAVGLDAYTELNSGWWEGKRVSGERARMGLYGAKILGKDSVSQLLFLPKDKKTGITVLTADVIHRFGVPCLGVKMDAVPGRENTCFVTPKISGFLEGNCYELCGVGHSNIMIGALVLPEDQYQDVLVQIVVREFEPKEDTFLYELSKETTG